MVTMRLEMDAASANVTVSLKRAEARLEEEKAAAVAVGFAYFRPHLAPFGSRSLSCLCHRASCLNMASSRARR